MYVFVYFRVMFIVGQWLRIRPTVVKHDWLNRVHRKSDSEVPGRLDLITPRLQYIKYNTILYTISYATRLITVWGGPYVIDVHYFQKIHDGFVQPFVIVTPSVEPSQRHEPLSDYVRDHRLNGFPVLDDR